MKSFAIFCLVLGIATASHANVPLPPPVLDMLKAGDDGFYHGHYANWEFKPGVGRVGGIFGVYIAILAATHGLDIASGLATIVPAGTLTDTFHRARRRGLSTARIKYGAD